MLSLCLLNDSATETVKHELKKQKGRFLGSMMVPMAASLIRCIVFSVIWPMASLLMNAISGKRVIKAGKGQWDEILLLIALALMIKAMYGKRVKQ